MTTNNQSLNLEPLILPNAPDWFPLAWGWWAVLGGVILSILIVALYLRWRSKRLVAKKTALKLLTNPITPHTPSSALEVLRQAALSYFPREDIAPLTGSAWYEFLDSYTKETRFVDKQQQWQAALYQKSGQEQHQDLIDDCTFWISTALPPKKKAKLVTEATLVSSLSQWMNIEFVWWWALLLLPLPWIIFKFFPEETQQAEIKLAYLPDSQHNSKPKQLVQKALSVGVWALLVIACARPVWYGDPVDFQPKYRDMMLVVDLSGSMQKEDMNYNGEYIDRLTAVKKSYPTS